MKNPRQKWSREFNGLANLDDEAVQLVVRGDRIFVTGAARNNANSQITTMGFTADGQIFSVKSFDSPFGQNDKPTAMGIDLDDNLIIVGQIQENDTTFRNRTVKYNVMEKQIVPVYVDSVPAYNARELIVSFDKSAMNLEAVDRKNFDAGLLKDFVHEHVIDSLNAKFPFDAGRLQTFKIFHRMTTADSLSITRLGDTIPVPAFWATLSVMFPEEYDLFEAIDSLNAMKPMVHYGEVNLFVKTASVPDDPLYGTVQKSLHPLLTPTPNPNNDDLVNHINIEGAWEIETGKSSVRVGVFDEIIYWQHEDFQVTQSSSNIPELSGTKIIAGKDYYSQAPLSSVSLPLHYHGTAVAGIIGAVRNNGLGIAGIAGGDVSNNPSDYGVEMLSFGILTNNYLYLGSPGGLSTDAWNAMLEGALNTPANFGYGIHIQNHSWQSSPYPAGYFSITLQQVVRQAWKNHCVIVAARGNNETPGTGDPMVPKFPACTDDRMIISVGASGTDGLRKTTNNLSSSWSTHFGLQMDVLAPGVNELVSTCYPINWPSPNAGIWPNNYGPFNGTSAAAPHVSGLAALMYSKHTTPNNLAAEDVEQILQKSTYQSQYVIANNSPNEHSAWLDSYTDPNAFGLINAQAALEYVNHPNYFVRHSQPSDIISSSVALVAQNTIVNLTEEDHHFYKNHVNLGTYVADKYEATWVIQVELPSNHEIIDFWPLFSKSCAGFKGPLDGQYSISHFEHFTFEPNLQNIYDNNVNIGFGTNTLNTITVKATYYFVKSPSPALPNQQQINKWLPECGTNNPNNLIPFSFSLHIRENNELGIIENPISELKVFPNPADNSVTLRLINSNIERLFIYDTQGRIVFYDELNVNSVQVDLTDFQKGLYIIRVESAEGIVSSSKLIKR